jgi:starch phosphorylase
MDAHAIPEFQPEPVGTDRESLKRSIANRLLYTVGKDPHAAHPRDWLTALSHVVRDRLVERWMATTRAQYQQDVKRVYYFSLEYLVGRALTNGLLALGVYEDCRAALAEMGIELSRLEALEEDAALGNGGLGRLAACFLDSMATLGLPGFGYGIRYDYGMFAQAFKDGWQVEHPDHWLAAGNPWEFPRSEVVYPVKFGGRVERRDGVAHWVDSDDVLAMAYDTIVPGYGTHAVNTLRLWSAKSTRDIDLAAFNRGHYSLAVEAKNHSENVSRVLYPDDSSADRQRLLAGHPAPLPGRSSGLEPAAGKDGGAPERHPSGPGGAGVDAPADRCPRLALGPGLGAERPGVLLHQPHAHARGP